MVLRRRGVNVSVSTSRHFTVKVYTVDILDFGV